MSPKRILSVEISEAAAIFSQISRIACVAALIYGPWLPVVS